MAIVYEKVSSTEYRAISGTALDIIIRKNEPARIYQAVVNCVVVKTKLGHEWSNTLSEAKQAVLDHIA